MWRVSGRLTNVTSNLQIQGKNLALLTSSARDTRERSSLLRSESRRGQAQAVWTVQLDFRSVQQIHGPNRGRLGRPGGRI
jgi:hypothetical protein